MAIAEWPCIRGGRHGTDSSSPSKAGEARGPGGDSSPTHGGRGVEGAKTTFQGRRGKKQTFQTTEGYTF